MGDTIVLALLRSPLARLLGGVCELEFLGRRSDRTVRLPVQYAQQRYPKATLSTNDPMLLIEPAPDPPGGRGW